MSDKEIQEIISQVLEALRSNSLTVDELLHINVLKGEDCVELNKGRKTSLDDIKLYLEQNEEQCIDVLTKDDDNLPTDLNVFSALRTLLEIANNNEVFKKIFLRKDQPDRTNFLMQLFGGVEVQGGMTSDSIEVGDYVPGWLGGGSAITVNEKTGKTRLEVDEALVRDRFETIEFRFNRIDVIDGEQWSTFAFGTIKSVDIENQIAYLDLVDGELMSSHKNDLNRGIFHNISSANASESKIDDCGFYTQAGFSTSYFTPTELLAKGNGFKYALRAGTSQHPCAGMKFAAYGNPTDPSRRMSRVTNLKHTIYLKDVSVWQIDPNVHYGAAYGDLTGITINGVEFNGYSSFQTNGYFKGHIEFLPGQKEELKGKDGYSVSLSSYDAVVAVNSDGKIDSSLYDIINIVSGNESAYTGDNQIVTTKYKIQTTIQATCGATKLEQSDVIGAGKYVVSVTPVGCEYHLSGGVITITKITQDKATLDIEINCEGIAVVKKTFTLTRVYAERGFTGADGKDIEFIYLRSKVDNVQSPESENTDGFVPDGWTDNPTGTTSEFIYELISRRIKVNGTWGSFSQPAPWARYAKDGKDGDSVTAKYSVNGTDWHDGFADGDIYMQLYTNGVASGSINRIVAEDGKNGQYTDFQFAKSISATVAPTEGWQDAPPSVSSSEYLWMRSGVVTPPLTAPSTWTAVRIGGTKGDSVDAEYSVDGESWHTLFAGGDLYMRQRIGDGEWTPAFRIVGETGKNGQYTDYQFAANESLTDAPASGWQDAPPVVSPGQYLWMRSGLVVPPEATPKTWTAVRIGGANGNDGKDGPGFEIIFCRTKTNAAPARPTGKNQDQYVPDGWTNDQTGTSALWPHEFSSQRRKINGTWGSFSEPALWANYSFDGDDAYSVALSSYDAVVAVNSAGEIDASLYDVVNVVSGQQLAYTGDYEVVTTKYKIQTVIYAWHGATQLVHSDTAAPGKYSVTITAVGCEYSIANGVITITRISQDKATLDIVVNCEGKITVNKTFTLTRVYGEKGFDGTNGADGVNGKDGVSIIFKGDFSSHPANPQNGWSYYNTADKKSYVYHGSWYVMTVDGSDGKDGIDGINGTNGNDGLPVVWKGDSVDPPGDPQKNWCYRDTDNGRVYIYNGVAWALMVADGNDGTDGTNGKNGSNGLSVFITYHDGEDHPATPTGNGTAGGWHTDATASVVWMSQKVAVDASSEEWGVPVRIKAKDGENGTDGTDANMLDWLKPWDDNKTMIDGEWVASPKMFSGKRNPDTGKLTGIAQGVDCITIDGKKRTGIFALVDDEVVFELDPITKKYLFRGRVEADEGVFKGKVEIAGGKILLNEDGSGKLANGAIEWDKDGNPVILGKFTTASEGKRIEIDPVDSSIKMYNEKGHVTSEVTFQKSPNSGSTNPDISYGLIKLYDLDASGNWIAKSVYTADGFSAESKQFSPDTYKIDVSAFGINIKKNGTVIKEL